MEAIGRAIRQRRAALGLSQEETAHRSGLTVRYYGDIERGKRRISIVMGMRVAKALGCKLQDILDAAESSHK